jgi:hypothetical protein
VDQAPQDKQIWWKQDEEIELEMLTIIMEQPEVEKKLEQRRNKQRRRWKSDLSKHSRWQPRGPRSCEGYGSQLRDHPG